MPTHEIRWICISDLHLGAENSLLTAVRDEGGLDLDRIAPVAEGLARCLRTLVAGQSELPRLVLLGDALELALTPMEQTLRAFELFLRTLAGSDPVIAPEIWYVPGNHDHHVWQVAMEEMYAAHLAEHADSDEMPPQWHFSWMSPFDARSSELPAMGRPSRAATLGHVAARAGLGGVEVVYPNLALHGDERTVLLHHGHFTEPTYLLMSLLRRAIFPDGGPDGDPWTGGRFWDLESDNGAWIEFVWSSLGRSGHVGQAVDAGFEMLGHSATAPVLVDRIVDVAMKRLADGRSGWQAGAVGLSEPAVRFAFDRLAERIGSRERFHAGGPFGPRIERGVHGYVGGPLRLQYLDECRRLGRPPASDVSFVFGHTHKPFATVTGVPHWPGPIGVVNTGGWVVDSVEPRPMAGSAVVLVDDDLHVASLRVCGQSANPANRGMRVEAPSGPGLLNPLARAVRDRVIVAEEPWRTMAAVAWSETEVRRRNLDRRLREAVESLRRL